MLSIPLSEALTVGHTSEAVVPGRFSLRPDFSWVPGPAGSCARYFAPGVGTGRPIDVDPLVLRIALAFGQGATAAEVAVSVGAAESKVAEVASALVTEGILSAAAPSEEAGRPAPSPAILTWAFGSGSTRVRELLEAHPAIACPPGNYVVEAMARCFETALRDRPFFPVLVPNLSAARRVIGTGIDALLTEYGARHQRRGWVLSAPELHTQMHLAEHLFPGVRFVVLVRHGADVVHFAVRALEKGWRGSRLVQRYLDSHSDPYVALARYWVDVHRELRVYAMAADAPLHVLRYEEVVRDADAALAPVFRLVGAEPMAVKDRAERLDARRAQREEALPPLGPEDHRPGAFRALAARRQHQLKELLGDELAAWDYQIDEQGQP